VVKHGSRVRAVRATSAAKHQQLYWAHRREAKQAREREAQRIIVKQDGVLQNAPKSVPYREIRRAVQSILQHIIVVISIFHGHGDKEIVMRMVWSDLITSALFPNTFRCSKDSITK
jgi:hypothetical protein